MRTMATPWQQLSQADQQKLIDRLAERVETFVAPCIAQLAAGGFTNVRAHLKQAVVTEDAIKVTINCPRDSEHAITDCVGRQIVVVFIDPEQHAAAMDTIRADADQPSLPLEIENGEDLEDYAAEATGPDIAGEGSTR
jgi:hypothetical protein